MTTLDDKLLGEKLQYYCSSSEDEREDDDDKSTGDNSEPSGSTAVGRGAGGTGATSSGRTPTNYTMTTDGIRLAGRRNEMETMNTGPKGVIRDFQQYKKFENEQRETQERERHLLLKKLQMTCRSYLDEKIEQKIEQINLNGDEDGLDADDENDPFIKEYIAKRMQDMIVNIQKRDAKKTFGQLQNLNHGEQFLQIVDDKDFKDILIVTHVFNRNIPECKRMNECLDLLSRKYPHVKFCSLDASVAGMSDQFIKFGVPALLIYKDGDLVGNFVSLGDEFGRDFDENDIEDFLVENNILISSQLISSISYNSNLSNLQQPHSKIRQTRQDDDDDDDEL